MVTKNNTKQMNAFADICKGTEFGYCDPELKNKMHRLGKAALEEIAIGMGLDKDPYDIRSNKGGIAASGEVTLYSENFYLQINPGTAMPEGCEILIRSCNDRRDFRGGANIFIGIEDLRNWSKVERAIMSVLLGKVGTNG